MNIGGDVSTDGDIYAKNLSSAVTSYTLYYNATTGKVTQGAAPTGDVTKAYVDGSLGKFIRSASTGTGLEWSGTSFRVADYVSKTYTDGSLGKFIRSASTGTGLAWTTGSFYVDDYVSATTVTNGLALKIDADSGNGTNNTFTNPKVTGDVSLGTYWTVGPDTDSSLCFKHAGTTKMKLTQNGDLLIAGDIIFNATF